MEFMANTFRERLKLIIQAVNLNNAQFARSIDVSATTIDTYIKGSKRKGELIFSLPNFDVIEKISRIHGVNPEYILGHSQVMFRKDLNIDLNKKNVAKFAFYNWDELMEMEDEVFATKFKEKAYLFAIGILKEEKKK